MDKWEHWFIDGEFMARAHLLSGLTLEQATLRLPGTPHSIYEELWHTARWQTIVVRGDREAAKAWVEAGPQFLPPEPVSERMWADLVAEFLDGSRKAVALGGSPEAGQEVRPGVTLADRLASLAVHNAYHMGKIAALRQAMGAWPPAAG